MEKEGGEGDTPFLPQGVIRNILRRLPVKSLIRFQCVCRHWRHLFKTPSFIADHLHHSNNQNPYLLFQRGCWWDSSSDLYWLDSEMQVREFQNPPFLDYLKRGKIVGSSNGLLCVETNRSYGFHYSLLVWNPAIKEVRLLPKTNFLKDSYYYSIGFGFCPTINDYKIVIIYSDEDYVEILKVYSLSARSWKEVKYRLNDTNCFISHSVTVNGVMFWWGSKEVGEDYENLIVSFDLAMEVCTVKPIPIPVQTDGIIPRLTVYEEKLAMFCCTINSDSVIDLWVMEEGVGASGETWNWTKKYTSDPYPCRLYPTTIWRNEIFCRAGVMEGSTAVLFNPTTEKIREKKFDISKCGNEYHIINYAESLVPIGGMKSFSNFPKGLDSFSGQ